MSIKILHVCVNGIYTDGFSYQENLLPKFHANMGYDVVIIASQYMMDTNGKKVLDNRNEYIDENGIKVVRLPIINHREIGERFIRFGGIYSTIKSEKPDIVFCHLFQFLDVREVIKYKKHNPEIKLYFDSHADYNNSARNWLSIKILHGCIWQYYAHQSIKCAEKIYGVTPLRVEFLKRVYHLPQDKCELLVMGADDIAVCSVREEDKTNLRKQYDITESDILIFTSGKIDRNKRETLNLMKAVSELNYSNVRLLVMGSVTPELQEDFNSLVDGAKVLYGGWMSSMDTYKYFMAADLVIFPGLHSVYWEQAVGSGCACVFRRIPGFDHVDLGGNCDFFEFVDVEGIKSKRVELISNQEKIKEMRDIAKEKGMKVFSYADIARRSIEL